MEKQKNKWVLQAAVFSALRRIFRRSPMYNSCLNNAKVEVRIRGKTKDNIRRVKFRCAVCGELFDKKEVEVDHIEPVIPLEGLPKLGDLPDYNVYIARLFCPLEDLQVICKIDHKAKSKEENARRRKLRPPAPKKRVKNEVNPRKSARPTTKNRRR